MRTLCSMTAKGSHPSSCWVEKFAKHCPKVGKPQAEPCVKLAADSELINKRRLIVFGGPPLVAVLTFTCGFSICSPAKALEKGQKDDENEEDKGILDSVKSLFDPNEKTKSGKVLPKAYLKSAREVVRTLRESLKEDTNDVAKFRKTADAAKGSIREYLEVLRGQPVVKAEESCVALEKAIRSLANFYSKAGPFAPLPEDVKAAILGDLDSAEASL